VTAQPELAELEAVAWRWRWRSIRCFIAEANFRGYTVKAIEGPGYWRRRFLVIGSKSGIDAIARQIDRL